MGKCTTVTMEEVDGAIATTSTVQAGGFKSSDGTAGLASASATNATDITITIKNGLVTAFTDNS